MVNNELKILDEGKIKYIAEVITMPKPEHIYRFEQLMFKWNMKFEERDAYCRNNSKEFPYSGWKHDHNQQHYDLLCRETDELEQDEFMMKFRYETFVEKYLWNTKDMCAYMKVEPFLTSVMINISPDWDGADPKTGRPVDKRSENQKIEILVNIIEGYLGEAPIRWGKASYVIENGSEGDHIHAHIVAQYHPMR